MYEFYIKCFDRLFISISRNIIALKRPPLLITMNKFNNADGFGLLSAIS